MSNQLSNINKNSALLVMDFQTIILNNFLPQEIAGNVIRNTASLIAAARAAAVPVIYISVGFRKGYPEVSKNNTIFSSIKENGMFMADNENTAIHPEVAPAENEAVIVKRRVGAFSIAAKPLCGSLQLSSHCVRGILWFCFVRVWSTIEQRLTLAGVPDRGTSRA